MWLLSNKIKVRDSGLLDGFCDCHCHLLPGVDDGVQDMAETLNTLKLWESVGVREVWMTPHVMEDMPNLPADLMKRFEEVMAHYTGGITLHLAAEHMMDGLFMSRLGEGLVMPLGKGRQRLLVETSYYNPPINMWQMVDSMKEQGYAVVLAHPERYQYMAMDDYAYWKAEGLLFQLNIPSLAGMYGPQVQRKAEELLKRGMYDCAGTDTHAIGFAEDFMEKPLKKRIVRDIRKIILQQQL